VGCYANQTVLGEALGSAHYLSGGRDRETFTNDFFENIRLKSSWFAQITPPIFGAETKNFLAQLFL